MLVDGLSTWPAPTTLVTPRDDVVALLFEPALRRASEYKRAVGYFSSAWIAHNASGLAHMASRGGRARWITSPHFSREDWEALVGGTVAPEVLVEKAAVSAAAELAEKLAHDTRNTIGWMVADGLLEFKIAVAAGEDADSDFHTKFGVFCDRIGPQVAFVGSMNESERGLRNHELISVFSTARDAERARVEEFDRIFESLWSGDDEAYDIYSLPEAARSKIIELRDEDRPYEPPRRSRFRSILRDYQVGALEAWVENGHHGILEMATGTGKTITALACAERVLGSSAPPKIVLVACPFQHLVDQWADQLRDLGVPVICAHEASAKWRPELRDLALMLETGVEKAGVVVTTYATLTSDYLERGLGRLIESTLFIADECHYLGARTAQSGMRPEHPYRLGLSATPQRHYDEGGTQKIVDYFDGVVYEFGLEKAIERGFLVPYTYEPEFVDLSWEEAQEYTQLSEQLSRLMAVSDDGPSEAALRIAIKRARVLNNASAKVEWLRGHLQSLPAESWQYALVYAGDRIFQPVTRLVGAELGIRMHEFTAQQSRAERASLLERFASGDLQVLAAMKCLDEGVDVPPTRTAFFLASSGNPREYVQRRGRILRPSPGKKAARIVDAIAVPPRDFLASMSGSSNWKAVRSALRSQAKRIEEFSRLAMNRVQAEGVVFDMRLKYDIPVSGQSDGDENEI